jgi:hypothetical protein
MPGLPAVPPDSPSLKATEPRNPLYGLLLLASLAFAVTAVAYAVLPVWEQQARDAGRPLDPSPFLDALRAHGTMWLLVELAAMIVFGLASMGLDRVRSLKKQRLESATSRSEPDER